MNIFISYSRHDIQIVNEIITDCRSLGHTVWLDQELSGGQSWWNQILKEIRECELVLFIVSNKSNNSTACKREYTYASQLNKRILPVIVDQVSTNLLPPELTAIHFIDYRQKDKTALLQLVKAIEGLPNPIDLPAQLPEPPELPVSYLGNLKEQIDTTQSLSFNDQTEILFKLKNALENSVENEEKDVYQLLKSFNNRDDLYNKIGKEIDELFANQSKQNKTETVLNDSPKPPPVNTQKTESANRGPIPKPKTTKKTDIIGILGIIAGIIFSFFPIVGIILGIISIYQTKKNPEKFKTHSYGWIAIGVTIMMFIIIVMVANMGY